MIVPLSNIFYKTTSGWLLLNRLSSFTTPLFLGIFESE